MIVSGYFHPMIAILLEVVAEADKPLLKLIPVDWQGIMAILEVLLLFNILMEARKNKRDIQMRVRAERLQFYAFFWKKWDRILEALPNGIFEPDFDLSKREDADAIMVTLRSYFDLCAQEFFMYEEGVIEESIWANWRRGLLSCMTLPVFRDAYGNLKVEMSYPEFHAWLSQSLAEAEIGNQADGGQVPDYAEE